jgi:hypothetical protein
MNFLNKLSEAPVLWFSFITTLLLSVVFQVVVDVWQLTLLDMMFDAERLKVAIASMTQQQRFVHVIVTATLDVIYPLAYGGFFIGAAFKFFPKMGSGLAVPSMMLILVDWFEGVIQIMALTDIAQWLEFKAQLTIMKYGLLIIAITIAVIGWSRWLLTRFK